jgi:hypothetical protein
MPLLIAGLREFFFAGAKKNRHIKNHERIEAL